MSKETIMVIYYALFHSTITYSILAWGGAYPTQKILLQRMQNKVLKIIQFFDLRRTPSQVKY